MLKVRIEDDLCTVSLDTSGEALHRRGHKEFVGKAPLRETLAAGALLMAGYDGSEPLLDPLCGTGTFSLEGALMTKRIPAGWFRDFAFTRWPSFIEKRWNYIKRQAGSDKPFFLYVGWSQVHYPAWPHPDFAGKSGAGPFGDSVMELDHRTGQVLDAGAKAVHVAPNTTSLITSKSISKGGEVTALFSFATASLAKQQEMAAQFNLPPKMYPRVNLLTMFLGPAVVFVFTLLAGLTVLWAAVQATRDERR